MTSSLSLSYPPGTSRTILGIELNSMAFLHALTLSDGYMVD